MGMVGVDRDGRGIRNRTHEGEKSEKCKGIISRGWERGKCVGRGDGASPLVMCSICAVNC